MDTESIKELTSSCCEGETIKDRRLKIFDFWFEVFIRFFLEITKPNKNKNLAVKGWDLDRVLGRPSRLNQKLNVNPWMAANQGQGIFDFDRLDKVEIIVLSACWRRRTESKGGKVQQKGTGAFTDSFKV